MTRIIRLSITAMLTLTASLATASPFCVVTGAGRQCRYFDVSSCQRVAARMGGACVVNSDEVRAPPSDASFCVVASFGTQCIYYNLQQCENAARAARGTCAAR
jgi:hypothetical protein